MKKHQSLFAGLLLTLLATGLEIFFLKILAPPAPTDDIPSGIEYLPIVYDEKDILNYPFHAFFKFEHPVTTDNMYLNVRILEPDNGMEIWSIQNLPIIAGAVARPIHYRMNLKDVSTDSLPPFLVATSSPREPQTHADFAGTVVELEAGPPVISTVPNGTPPDHYPFIIPYFRPIYIPPILPDSIDILVRGCEVPNIDLDSSAHPDSDPTDGIDDGDYNSCGPAAAANSLKWLMETDPNIPDTLGLREMMDSLEIMMKKSPDSLIITPNPMDSTMMDTVFKPGGVFWWNIVAGKLELIDRYRLPIKVKYQTHTPNDSTWETISSGDPTYGHYAENETGESGIPDFDWICNELEEGEDVELHLNYWCRDPENPDTLIQSTGHYVNLVGYAKFGVECWLMWKHDINQAGPEGTIEEYGRWQKAKKANETDPDAPEYPMINEMGDTSSAGYVAYVGSVISESYDPDALFCPVKVCIPDDSGPGTLREAMECSTDGAVITLGPELAGQSIVLTSDHLTATANITIVANPGDNITVMFEKEFGFVTDMTANLTLQGFRVVAGTGATGSALLNNGNATLHDMMIFDHTGNPGSAILVQNHGQLNFTGTTHLKRD